jgi:hypothetical protein
MKVSGVFVQQNKREVFGNRRKRFAVSEFLSIEGLMK